MEDRLVQITAPRDKIDAIRKLAERDDVELQSVSRLEKDRRTITLLVRPKARQELFDDVQSTLGRSKDWRMVSLPVEAIVPEPEEPDEEKIVEESISETREELYEEIAKGAVVSNATLMLTALSGIVAAVGMIQNSIPVVIGAMVIAPLLGPILAVILGTSLGEISLILRASRAAALGIATAIAVGLVIGLAFEFRVSNGEIAARTHVGADNVALALASGAAAALSVMTGISGVLVGVMVAAALLPPAVASGLLLGKGALAEASGAGLMLAVNVAAMTMAGQVAFLVQGLRPRTWYRRKAARQSVIISLLFWTSALVILGGLILLRRKLVGS
jgi:uncharacterized hydrophobic protein (TIGR00341 family)